MYSIETGQMSAVETGQMYETRARHQTNSDIHVCLFEIGFVAAWRAFDACVCWVCERLRSQGRIIPWHCKWTLRIVAPFKNLPIALKFTTQFPKLRWSRTTSPGLWPRYEGLPNSLVQVLSRIHPKTTVADFFWIHPLPIVSGQAPSFVETGLMSSVETG